MTVSEVLSAAAEQLKKSGVADPRLEAASLLAFVLGRDRTFLFAHPEYELTSDEAARYADAVGRRSDREPFQYIVGKQEFYGLEFEVSPDVLIPRPETELLVRRAIDLLSGHHAPRFLEIGIGSGCISVSILKTVRSAIAIGADLSEPVLAVAARNARKHGVEERLKLLTSNLYSALSDDRFDAILANPPYVPAADIDSLQPEVRNFEPVIALTDGSDGLTIIERIVREAPQFLVPQGSLLIEVGFGQAQNVKTMYDDRVWHSVEFFDDFQAIPRVAVAVLG